MFRNHEVIVAEHVAPAHESIPFLLKLFESIYSPDKLHGVLDLIVNTSYRLFVEISDVEGIDNVWASIIPLNMYLPETTQDFETPLINVPKIPLAPQGNGRYESIYNGFTLNGAFNPCTLFNNNYDMSFHHFLQYFNRLTRPNCAITQNSCRSINNNIHSSYILQ